MELERWTHLMWAVACTRDFKSQWCIHSITDDPDYYSNKEMINQNYFLNRPEYHEYYTPRNVVAVVCALNEVIMCTFLPA
jgi:hypothetical protein